MQFLSSSCVFQLLFHLCLALLTERSIAESSSSCKAWLVLSIQRIWPTFLEFLASSLLMLSDGWPETPLRNLTSWPQPEDPRSGDYGYSEEYIERFGANEGRQVYKSVEKAADREVSIRLLQHSGVYPDYNKEALELASGRPNVQNVTLLLSDWWGSGIIHAKVWISDGKDVYIGSANNDWKSLTQVKEVGIYLVGCSSIAKKVEVYYDNLWKLASLDSSAYTETVWDRLWQARRKVPCWSHFVSYWKRCRSPLPSYVDVPHVAGYPVLSDPISFTCQLRLLDATILLRPIAQAIFHLPLQRD